MTTKKKAAPSQATATTKPHRLYQPPLPLGEPTGEELKEAALAEFEGLRREIVLRARRALLMHLLVHGTATADDVRDLVELPDGISPTCLGAVPGALARAGIIRRAGHIPSKRPERHASPTAVWELLSETAAVEWLAEHATTNGVAT